MKEHESDKDKPQIDKFKEAARELETDDREDVFDANLKKISVVHKSAKDGERVSLLKSKNGAPK